MFRCVTLAAVMVAISSAALLVAVPAAAQTARNFPATALRGELIVTDPPNALLNRQPARLAPGARIRGADNLLQMSGAVIGQPLLVHYTLDPLGLVLDVWVLTADELARKPWPTTPQQAAAWAFNPDTQSWSRP